jgi:hypothetical protein
LLLAERRHATALWVLKRSTVEHGAFLLHSVVELLLLLLLKIVLLLFHLSIAAAAEVVGQGTAAAHAHGSFPVDEFLHRHAAFALRSEMRGQPAESSTHTLLNESMRARECAAVRRHQYAATHIPHSRLEKDGRAWEDILVHASSECPFRSALRVRSPLVVPCRRRRRRD